MRADLSGPKNEEYEYTAKLYDIRLLFEVFADRNYNNDGTLVSRMEDNAIIHEELDVITRVVNLKEKSFVTSIEGHKIFLKSDSICVHGDNEKALDFIKLVRKTLI